MFDRDPGFNKKRRPLEKLSADLASALAAVEAAGGTPEQMMNRANAALDGALLVSQGLEETLTELAGLQIDDGERSQSLRVNGVPEPVGHGRGAVVLFPVGGPYGFAGYGEMVDAIRDRIDTKTDQRQLGDTPCLKWLAVVLDDTPSAQLIQYFGPASPMQSPTLEGISFDYFHEVWAAAGTRIGEDRREGFVVLRLSEGGNKQQPHIVSRS